MCTSERPNIKTAIDNLKQSLPIGEKIGLLIKNSLIKITTTKKLLWSSRRTWLLTEIISLTGQ